MRLGIIIMELTKLNKQELNTKIISLTFQVLLKLQYILNSRILSDKCSS